MKKNTNSRTCVSKSLVRLFSCILALCLFCAIPTLGAETVVYSEGFEATDGGYTHTGSYNQWEWGTPTSGPGSAHSGSKVWATNLAGNVNHATTVNEYLTSPAIAVPALGPNQIARARFYGWIEIDEMYDRGEFQVSSDGVSWETKAEFFHIMQGDWTEYYFDVSNYAGGNIYLRFRVYMDIQEAFWVTLGGPPPYSVPLKNAGWYIDDIAIIITDTPAIQTILTLEGWEDQYAYASCPWVYTWDGTSFVKDNDVYSTARGESKEFTDYYNLNKPLVEKDGQYLLELRETEDESSYTDLVQLIAVDHASGVEIASDENGNILTYSSPQSPQTATYNSGADVLSPISVQDDSGVAVYDNDVIELDFSNLNTAEGATLVLRARGFRVDEDEGAQTFKQPFIYIQTQDSSGDWVTRNRFYPRWEASTSAYDLKDYLTENQKVRLLVTSCHEGKYHAIDYVGIDTAAQEPVTINVLSASSAAHNINGDILSALTASDDNYATMTPLEYISVAFDAPASAGEARSFVFVSEGYYVPMGTFFIYTWDGNAWQQRDGWSQEGNSDSTETFDLSIWLPDPDGEYKVRIWQDYWYNAARIDYVGLSRDGVPGTLDTAKDLRGTASRYNTGPIPWADATVKAAVIASDNSYMNYPLEYYNDYYLGSYGYIRRDRWLEASWTGFAANTPPSTNPVSISDPADLTPTISWTYNDADGDPQAEYEVEVWTGPGGTGANLWDPAVGTGTAGSVVYAGTALVAGQTYYARVKAFDGTNWGAWSEAGITVVSSTRVNIDIYPNRTPNRVFLSRLYTIYVAVLGSADFDVTTINSSTVKFGRTGTEASPQRAYLLRDLNGDGFIDAMFGFLTQDCGFQLGDTEGKLTGGSTLSGTPIEGVDSVLVSP